jgi:hypothetical protein
VVGHPSHSTVVLMPPAEFCSRILDPGLTLVQNLCGIPISVQARQFLLAVAIQESALRHRYQTASYGAAGPARGWWQFEQGGGVKGVMQHPSSSGKAETLCNRLAVDWDRAAIWRALEGHDMLAVGFARLLLWTDYRNIPMNSDDAWDAYANRLWRPGKPHREKWNNNWETAKQCQSS